MQCTKCNGEMVFEALCSIDTSCLSHGVYFCSLCGARVSLPLVYLRENNGDQGPWEEPKLSTEATHHIEEAVQHLKEISPPKGGAGETSSEKLRVQGGALRFNEGKTPMAYVPLDLLDGAARVMQRGAVKYGDPENYRKGYDDLRSPLSSLMRHLVAVQRSIAEEDIDGSSGHLLDKESGEAHIHHLVTSTLLLIHSMRLKGYKV